MSKYNLIDLYEGMSDKDYDAAKEAERLEAHPEKDKIKAVQAMMAKEKSLKNESEIEEVTSRVGSRISGMIHRPFLVNFLEKFAEIYQDLIDNGEEFDVQDVIDFLSIEMSVFADDRGLKAMLDMNEESEKINELSSDAIEALTGLIGAGGVVGGAVAINKLMDALEAGKLGDKGKAVAKYLRDTAKGFQAARLKEGEVNELSSDAIEALTGIIGAGGVVGGAVAINKLMDALEAGKLGDKGKAVAKYLRDTAQGFKSARLSEGDPIVDESEFFFFQTLVDGQYSEEEIERYLKSDEYQEELQHSTLDMSDAENWLNDMSEFFNKRKSVDEEDDKLKEHFSRFMKSYK